MDKYEKLYETFEDEEFSPTEMLKIICATFTRLAREQGKDYVDVSIEMAGEGMIYSITIKGVNNER